MPSDQDMAFKVYVDRFKYNLNKRFELENGIQTMDVNQLFAYDEAGQKQILQSKPWTDE